MKTNLQFYWHIHHDVLCEPLTEPIENLIKSIKENKPKEEVELRLRLLKPIKSELLKEFVEAWAEARDKSRKARDKACNAWDEADKAWKEADEVWDKANEAYTTEIEALHKLECPDCNWDGISI